MWLADCSNACVHFWLGSGPLAARASTDDATPHQPLWLWVLGALWAIFVVCGLLVLWAYDNAPGETGRSPARWPDETRLVRGADQPTLVLFAHPQCSCTRAS